MFNRHKTCDMAVPENILLNSIVFERISENHERGFHVSMFTLRCDNAGITKADEVSIHAIPRHIAGQTLQS